MIGNPSKDLTPNGSVSPKFEQVKTEFKRNFIERGELGAACAVYYKGQKVVDLWGGIRDEKSGDAWKEDTLVHVFSTTKGVAALTVAVAQSRGLFEYDDKIATYWPEFAQNGKEDITVRELMSFQSGLCYIDRKLDERMIADLDGLAQLLARQKPAWRPGDYHGYHLFTADWCAGELIRRRDAKHRSLGRYFQEEIAQPLGLEFYIGTPDNIPDTRFAVIKDFMPLEMLYHLDTMPWGLVLGLMVPNSLAVRVMMNVKFKSPAHMGLPPYRRVEIPGGNGIGQVRSLAKLYGVFAAGGRELGLKQATLEALAHPARPPRFGTKDKVFGSEIIYSLGFLKPFAGYNYSPSSKAFGAGGTGGSHAFADPEAQIGFAYAPNKLGFHMFNDPREKALREAVYRCI
jgi:CubicO group peptidase (beta-lactamase class C family)